MFFYSESEQQATTIPTSWSEVEKLIGGGQTGREISVSADANIFISGDWTYEVNGASFAGALNVYEFTDGSWQLTKIFSTEPQESDRFGLYHDISGDGSTIVCSAWSEDPSNITDAGSVYIFQKINSSWTQVQKLTASDKAANDGFGFSVSTNFDGSIIAIGAKRKDYSLSKTDTGKVYVFKKSNSSWTQVQMLTMPDVATTGFTGDNYGDNLCLSQNAKTLLISASPKDSSNIANHGYIYVYSFNEITLVYDLVQTLSASTLEADSYFGESISLNYDGTIIAVGSYLENSVFNNEGAVYIFEKQNSTYILQEKLVSSDKQEGDFFGSSVSLNDEGTILAVGADTEDPDGLSNAGSVYVFTRQNTTWVETQKITASDKTTNYRFGWSTALDSTGEKMFIGSTGAGSVYVFQGT